MFSDNHQIETAVYSPEQKWHNQDWHVCESPTSSDIFTNFQLDNVCSYGNTVVCMFCNQVTLIFGWRHCLNGHEATPYLSEPLPKMWEKFVLYFCPVPRPLQLVLLKELFCHPSFSLYTNDCTGTDITPVIKYSDHSALQDHSNSDTEYFDQVQKFHLWCKINYLDLNVNNTKELLVDFR